MIISLIYFAAGIGVFIWGIFTLTRGLKVFSHQKISQIINNFASNLLKSIIIGFL
ncbi:hypothetical protein ThesiDRAFT1_0625 [Thermoanaerobacter siderophilus SR4]|uniref:Uncharacterized protein n=1 Tax=Thermoanaerobacter siderophilus SR4 TaxID=880478 RepID=I9AC90_9THEO|nr:hypothetical protein ThesiDRAFT1_0625 [Thermoanaerobacter siderophilus SR4]